MNEWMPIDSAPRDGGWEVSSDGQVRNNRGVRRQHTSSSGYAKVCIGSRTMAVHRLVAMAFLSSANPLLEVNHKNGIKKDNRSENLEWCTRSQNMRHAYASGLHSGVILRGKESPNFGRNGKRHPQSMPVVGIFPDGSSRVYDSQGLAAADGFLPNKISSCIHGRIKTHRGVAWMPLPPPPTDRRTPEQAE